MSSLPAPPPFLPLYLLFAGGTRSFSIRENVSQSTSPDSGKLSIPYPYRMRNKYRGIRQNHTPLVALKRIRLMKHAVACLKRSRAIARHHRASLARFAVFSALSLFLSLCGAREEDFTMKLLFAVSAATNAAGCIIIIIIIITTTAHSRGLYCAFGQALLHLWPRRVAGVITLP